MVKYLKNALSNCQSRSLKLSSSSSDTRVWDRGTLFSFLVFTKMAGGALGDGEAMGHATRDMFQKVSEFLKGGVHGNKKFLWDTPPFPALVGSCGGENAEGLSSLLLLTL